jgi:hypothetical protein
MQAELIFKIPEETSEFMMASWGHKYWAALTEINGALRNHTKHGVCKADTIAVIKAVMDDINPLMEEVV